MRKFPPPSKKKSGSAIFYFVKTIKNYYYYLQFKLLEYQFAKLFSVEKTEVYNLEQDKSVKELFKLKAILTALIF